MSVNRVELLGRLGADPEIRYTQSGTPVASFSLATTEQWKDKNGEKKEKTDWHRATAWNGTAELVSKYLGKGSRVYLTGRLETSSYEKDGETRYTTQVIIQQLEFLDHKPAPAGPPPIEPPADRQKNSRKNQAPAASASNDDIPF